MSTSRNAFSNHKRIEICVKFFEFGVAFFDVVVVDSLEKVY